MLEGVGSTNHKNLQTHSNKHSGQHYRKKLINFLLNNVSRVIAFADK